VLSSGERHLGGLLHTGTRPGEVGADLPRVSTIMSETEDDRAVSTIPLDTEDGETVVISQQNVGPANQVGGGEYKNVNHHKSPDEAADEQSRLQDNAPVDTSETT
jgi:hypothetical protein